MLVDRNHLMNKMSVLLIYHNLQRLTIYQDDGLNSHQCGANLREKPTKKDAMLDMLMIMTDKVTVRFKAEDRSYEMVIGRWCTVCK